MKNLAEKLEQIINESDANMAEFDQISKFEDTMKDLQKVVTFAKPTYVFPQVDTIGKQTYTSLNKK
jgi:hypothetical protein